MRLHLLLGLLTELGLVMVPPACVLAGSLRAGVWLQMACLVVYLFGYLSVTICLDSLLWMAGAITLRRASADALSMLANPLLHLLSLTGLVLVVASRPVVKAADARRSPAVAPSHR
jgi:hypothetical protein